jgi:hypothetical protein
VLVLVLQLRLLVTCKVPSGAPLSGQIFQNVPSLSHDEEVIVTLSGVLKFSK